MKPYRVPFHIKVNRYFMRPAFRGIFRVFGRIKICGIENIPLGLPYIAAFNHVSIFDPPVMLSFWPEDPEVVGAAEVIAKKDQGLILKLYGTIPVHHGQYDRALLETMVSVLKSGYPLVIAPEGGRSHSPGMQRAWPGIGYVLEHANVPVVPVGLTGTTSDFWQRAKRGEKPEIEIRIGRPITLNVTQAKGIERKQTRQANADLIMRHIAGLLPEEYHGVYAGQALASA